ncbi:hypothetical protein ACF0H5_011561 [Mactra antiquata]
MEKMATEELDEEKAKDSGDVGYHPIEVNGTNDLICAPCYSSGEENGAAGICKECKYYLCGQCIHQHRSTEPYSLHKIALFYCAMKRKINKLVRANSFCLDCGQYLCQRCKLNHGGFREYRHHTFIGGKTKLNDPYDHRDLLPRRKTIQSRGSRESRGSRKDASRMSIFTQREFGNKSPYLNKIETVKNQPKKRTVQVEEKMVERPRKLLYSNVGRANNGDSLLKPEGNEHKEQNDIKHVRYEEDHQARPAELIGEYNLKGPDDRRPCKVISSIFIGLDKLVISDLGNQNIKLYNAEFQCQSTMKMNRFPVALCKVRDNDLEVFASCGNKVLLLHAFNTLTLVRVIETSIPRIEGLASWNSGLAAVFKSIRSKHDKKGHLEIHLINYDGETQYEVVISSQFIVKLETPIWYIAFTKDDRYVLLSDTFNNRIVCIDTSNWHVVYVLRGRTSGGAPKSLSLDENGNLLVTWYGEVRKISPYGRDLGLYVSNLSERATISYNEQTKHLAIPAWSQIMPNRLRVFKLN